MQRFFFCVALIPNCFIFSGWEDTVIRGGTRREKLLHISEFVYDRFVNGIETNSIMHDLELRRYTLHASNEVGWKIVKHR